MKRSQWLGAGLLGLTVGLATAAVLGPLGAGMIRYRVSGVMVSQLESVDLVSSVAVAPLCAVIGLLAMRGRRAAPALALGPAVYVLYLFAETIVGPNYLGVAGNNEQFFPLVTALFVLAAAVLVTAWNQIDPSELGSPRCRLTVSQAAYSWHWERFGAGPLSPWARRRQGRSTDQQGLLGGANHLLDHRPGRSRHRHPRHDHRGHRHVARSAMGDRARFAVAGWAALVPVAVASMAATTYADHQPSASLSAVALLSVMAAVFLVPATLCCLPLRHLPSGDTPQVTVDIPERSTKAA